MAPSVLSVHWQSCRRSRKFVALIVAVLFTAGLVAAENRPHKYRRAEPPRWDELPAGVFFHDAFREALVGPAPDTSEAGATHDPASNDAGVKRPASHLESSPSPNWADMISAETLEDEVKRLWRRIESQLDNPSEFAAGGYQDYRRAMSLVAVLFAVIDQYPGSVRWQADGAAASQRFGLSARQTTSGDRQLYQQARQRTAELADLVRGESVTGLLVGAAPAWSDIAERPAIMERLDAAEQAALGPALQTEKEFQLGRELIRREAELIQLWSAILALPEMPDAADEDYASYCRQLAHAAARLKDAVDREDYIQAAQALSAARQACSACHQAYRAE